MNEDPAVSEPHRVKTWWINPFTGTKIFFVPCPSHEVTVAIII